MLDIACSGFIANTGFGWFAHFLHRAEPPDEVDFWQPSPPGFKAIPPGAPFFFRLGAPHKAIAGYGFFARYERVPAWLAWESSAMNGPIAEIAARIEAIRRRSGSTLLTRPQDNEVGCTMISQPVFFARGDWVADHADWHPRIQGGKTIDVSPVTASASSPSALSARRGFGRRRSRSQTTSTASARRRSCSHASARAPSASPSPAPTASAPPSGNHSLPALEAAHVRPYADGGAHALPNGLRCAPTSTASTTPATSPSRRTTASASATTRRRFHNGREYERFAGRAITVPRTLPDQPNPELLDWHAVEVFQG